MAHPYILAEQTKNLVDRVNGEIQAAVEATKSSYDQVVTSCLAQAEIIQKENSHLKSELYSTHAQNCELKTSLSQHQDFQARAQAARVDACNRLKSLFQDCQISCDALGTPVFHDPYLSPNIRAVIQSLLALVELDQLCTNPELSVKAPVSEAFT